MKALEPLTLPRMVVTSVIPYRWLQSEGGAGGAYVVSTTSITGTANNGAASSYGNLLTALGGSGGKYQVVSSYLTVALGTVGRRGTTLLLEQRQNPINASYRDAIFHGSNGANGWLPGIDLSNIVQEYSRGTYDVTSCTNVAQTVPFGAAGSVYALNTTTIPVVDVRGGLGGIGYGAGGGGMVYRDLNRSQFVTTSGGNAGEIKMYTYTLSSTAAVAVTVGLGGTGYISGTLGNSFYVGGGGARGCVAVFW